MNAHIDFRADDWDRLEEHLLENDLEQGAFLLAEPVVRSDAIRLLVREVLPVPREHLLAQSGAYLETDPLFFAPILKRARSERYAVVVVHSHPFSRGRVGFSSIDDAGEEDLIPKIKARIPGIPHAALVVARGAAAARVYEIGSSTPIQAGIRSVGRVIVNLSESMSPANGASDPRYHRQRLVWGSGVQESLSRLHVGVVGAGGTGSHVIQQLLHLGVGLVRAIDPDTVEESNLNRLVTATRDDVATRNLKVGVAERLATALGRAEAIESVPESALGRAVSLALVDLDVLFGCTDNLETRRLLNRVSLQYYVPLIDIGVDLEVGPDGRLRTGAGRVTLVLPDGPCLHRAGVINGIPEVPPDYVRGARDPAPAVVSLNGVVGSLAVTTFLSVLGALPVDDGLGVQLLYRPTTGRVMQESVAGLCEDCAAIVGVGDSRPLPWAWSASSASGRI